MNQLLDIMRRVNLLRCFVLIVVVGALIFFYRSALRKLEDQTFSRLSAHRIYIKCMARVCMVYRTN